MRSLQKHSKAVTQSPLSRRFALGEHTLKARGLPLEEIRAPNSHLSQRVGHVPGTISVEFWVLKPRK